MSIGTERSHAAPTDWFPSNDLFQQLLYLAQIGRPHFRTESRVIEELTRAIPAIILEADHHARAQRPDGIVLHILTNTKPPASRIESGTEVQHVSNELIAPLQNQYMRSEIQNSAYRGSHSSSPIIAANSLKWIRSSDGR